MRGWSITNYSTVPDVNLVNGQAAAVLQLTGLLPPNTGLLQFLNTARIKDYGVRRLVMHTASRYVEFLTMPGLTLYEKADKLREWGVPEASVKALLNGSVI